MVDLGINVIILRVKSSTLGEVWDIPVMGKTLEQWTASALNAPYKTVDAPPIVDLADRLKKAVDSAKPITVVLYCDTPLISQKTVSIAVDKLKEQNASMIKLARGCVFKTDYILSAQSVYAQEPAGGGEFEAVTDCDSLSDVTDIIRKRILHYHASNGIRITDFANTYIDCDVVINKGAVIEPYNFLKGKTIVKSDAHILPGNYIENCIIGRGARIDSSRLYDSLIGAETTVGPFAYIRPNTVIGCSCRIGDYVELKNCVIGDGSKVSHLTYIGDAELGRDCNVGCGVVFANYDGKNKYKSVVGSRVFIGSNSNIVAPVNIEDCAFIAAGSTITKEVPAHALAIARARQTVKPDWAGNAYAPINTKTPPKSFNLVRYSDGIIDGAASSATNAQPSDDDMPTDENNTENNGR